MLFIKSMQATKQGLAIRRRGSLGRRLARKRHLRRCSSWLEGYPTRSSKLGILLYPLGFLVGAAAESGRMTVWAKQSDD